ncbi:MAG TPA: hypothetical protein VNH44_05220 [Micropepsaceae bacterium]|nr:hypothetical protein [Micropepsaceae bacterium]
MRVLFSWLLRVMGVLGAVLCALLDIYIVLNPGLIAPYSRMIGILTITMLGFAIWLMARFAVFLIEQ